MHIYMKITYQYMTFLHNQQVDLHHNMLLNKININFNSLVVQV